MSLDPSTKIAALDVLLVDDDADHRWLTRDALCQTDHPCRIHEAATAEEALAMLLRTDPNREWVNPDVIFLDIEMPGMDGLAFMEQIKAHPELQGVEVVFLTGIDLSEKQLEAIRRSGAHSLIFKSRNIMDMARALQNPLKQIPPSQLQNGTRGNA